MLVGGRAERLMEQREQQMPVLALLVMCASFGHGLLGAALLPLAAYMDRHRQEVRVMTSEVEVQVPPPPPSAPPPEPSTPPPTPSAAPEPARPQPRAEAPRPTQAPQPQPSSAPPPAPPPTQAAPLMVVEGEMDSDDVVATGNNANATGDTSSDGVVRPPGERVTGARIGGTGTGPGTGSGPAPPPPPPPVDLATPSSLECDESALAEFFPDAAREAGITEMTVRVRYTVDENGRVTAVNALNDPGYGFATSVVRMIRSSHCSGTAARDRAGHSVTDTRTRPIHFMIE